MDRHIIRLSSVTYAMRAQKLLEQRGMRATAKRLARSLHVQGCGYGIEFDGDLNTALQILSSYGIRVVEVVR